MEENQKKQILENSGFKCAKCSYYDPLGKNLNIVLGIPLCSICRTFAPSDNREEFEKYINEKLNWQLLETFRNSNTNKASHNVHKEGMITGAKKGKLMARPPFGYKVENGNLIPNEDSENVRLIFKEFLAGKSLNQLSQTYGISVNGLKKILKNFTYLGKIKFNNEISSGSHLALITPEMFNSAQKRFEFLNNKR